MPNDNDRFGGSPGDIAKDGSSIYSAADFTEEVMAYYQQERAALGTPWGDKNLEGDDFAKDYDKVFTQLEENFNIYMKALVQATADTADNLVKTAKNLDGTESANEEIAAVPNPGTGSGGRR
ncbi:hypothetical protein KIK06_08930 [Nocardiopsis sp. EMB25]|uniref:hypothetical protein n=1 Tax=Nocardiopsis TaxID=2013 RepID=UPI00034DDDFA|nr:MULTISPECIES: hypothetical protein [Nocardiopsis]MCY9784015.1 hypothetical protein [Nocardiopsis sp. EMB25]